MGTRAGGQQQGEAEKRVEASLGCAPNGRLVKRRGRTRNAFKLSRMALSLGATSHQSQRMAWGSGDIGGPLRKIAAGNPAAIHILDCLANMLGVDVVDNTPDCPYTHTLTERQQYQMDFIERFQFEQSHSKASVAARLDSLELRLMMSPLAPGAAEGEGPESATASGDDQTPACAICLCDFGQNEHAMVFKKCGHAFHCKCLNPWLDRSSTCPCCRGKLMEEHVSSLITSSSAVAAPSDVAHLIREGSGILPSSSSSDLNFGDFRFDGRAEVFLDTTAPSASDLDNVINERARTSQELDISAIVGAVHFDELVECDEAQQQ